eukprot:555493_1
MGHQYVSLHFVLCMINMIHHHIYLMLATMKIIHITIILQMLSQHHKYLMVCMVYIVEYGINDAPAIFHTCGVPQQNATSPHLFYGLNDEYALEMFHGLCDVKYCLSKIILRQYYRMILLVKMQHHRIYFMVQMMKIMHHCIYLMIHMVVNMVKLMHWKYFIVYVVLNMVSHYQYLLLLMMKMILHQYYFMILLVKMQHGLNNENNALLHLFNGTYGAEYGKNDTWKTLYGLYHDKYGPL